MVMRCSSRVQSGMPCLLTLLAVAWLTHSAGATGPDRHSLNPETNRSPTGDSELSVDPSTIHRQREDGRRLTQELEKLGAAS